MNRIWTTEQQKVISLRGKNLLVSAAAGSGKTAVLVERILSMVTDPAQPVDIDRLLIMTFTRAAAGELRTRLRAALEERLLLEPDNAHLQRQTLLIHNTQITTIHGFCSYVIRNYFHMLQLDPGYRVGDEGELTLLRTEVLGKVIEEAYEEGAEDYLTFVEGYCAGKSDANLEELILELYHFSMSNPWPMDSLKEWEDAYALTSVEELRQTPWMQLLWRETKKVVDEGISIVRQNLALAGKTDGPAAYEKALLEDLAFFQTLADTTEYNQMHALLEKPGWARLAAIKDKQVSDDLKAQVQDGRAQMKKLAEKLRDDYFPATEEEALQAILDCQGSIRVLVSLTRRFTEAFAEAKRAKNLLDFSDMEHFALDILLKKDGETITTTQAAQELSLWYEEVLVDEYQDSNLVQECLMNAVSGWAKEKHNLFMVGDVKQSIYRFRLARPELFMEKLYSYALENGENQRIDLHKNFRSRSQILDMVNDLFRQCMGADLGGVEYDDSAALYPGASYPEDTDPTACRTEVLLFEEDSFSMLAKAAGTAREQEALIVASKIRQMVGQEPVTDSEGRRRPMRYGDIVILLRTMDGWADTFVQVLTAQGIPAHTASKTGYFSALEVVTVLNLLRLLDNPRQEIPFAGVLRSPIVGCSDEELAALRLLAPKKPLYQCARLYLEQGEDERLQKKLTDFWQLLDAFRQIVPYTPIHRLLQKLLEETGYAHYAGALPGGEQRLANLHMLVERAMDFEKTSYRGLFHFIRYIEHLQKYKVDFGEVNSIGDGADTVEILSIHKSKGLEFPVVFVSGLGKEFNIQETRAALVMHQELGIGADAVYPALRGKFPTLPKEVIRRQLRLENLGEEMRILYVALTRARERLVLTGAFKKPQKRLQALLPLTWSPKERLPLRLRENAASYLDWILPALAQHRDFAPLYQAFDLESRPDNPLYEKGPAFSIHLVREEELVLGEVQQQIHQSVLKEQLFHPQDAPTDLSLAQEIDERFSFAYPYRDREEIPVKISVSELKRQQAQPEEDCSYYAQPDIIPLIPRFWQAADAKEFQGAARGTIYHRVLQCLDYTKTDDLQALQHQLAAMVTEKKLSESEAACVSSNDLWQFITSPLGQRMKQAAAKGMLMRERPFVLSRPANSIRPDWPADEQVLVQGIIDAFFQEGEELVLVDYKTDHIAPGEEIGLLTRYQVQLFSYREALQRLTKKRVKETYIYAFSLGRALLLPETL